MTDAKPLLKTALKRYPTTEALLAGKLTSPFFDFEFHEIEPIHDAFKPMAQQQAFDVSEMAIFTYLQARTYHKPLVLLPVVLAARFQHPCIVYNTNFHKDLSPDMLTGKKVGVRAYSQTTGAWVRNILATEHAVDLEKIKWTTFEGGHLAEYSEPDFVTRAPEGTKLLPMLMSGQVDAGILGNDLPDDPCIKAVIANAKTAGRAWFDKTGQIPINHMLVVTKKLADERPDIVREVFRLFVEAKKAAPANPDQPDLRPIGIEAITPSLQVVVDLAQHQKLIPETFSIDELFADARAILGASAG
ncbi:MAG: phosphate ABC transporter substrate-binding protein [Hyphomicrobiales bacterium]|nr:phosphate ABC transporter substrate-binding protein [Hyphomicrobiales bacterium]